MSKTVKLLSKKYIGVSRGTSRVMSILIRVFPVRAAT